jgi:4-amino-4-deoxy-L-arabinose transferase-like glycosyltransferase
MWQRVLWARRKLASWGHRLASPEWRRRILVPFHLFGIPLLVYAMPIIVQGVDNIRLISVFSSDEKNIVRMVMYMFRSHTLAPRVFPFFRHPSLIYYLVGLFVAPYALLFPIDVPAVIVAARLVSVIFGVFSLCATYLLAARLFNPKVGLLASLFMLTTPNFLEWSVTAHPETPQLFFILLSVYSGSLLIECYRLRDVALASLFAGFAFGTKYAGAFLLPVIWLSCFLALLKGREKSGSRNLRILAWQIILNSVLIVLVFVGAFLLTNPYAAIDFQRFEMDLRYESGHVRTGHVYRGEGGREWLKMLSSDRLLGDTVSGLFLLSLLMAASDLWSHRGRPFLDRLGGSVVAFFWITAFLLYLLLQARYMAAHHLLPTVPFIVIFAAYGAIRLLSSDFRFLPLNLVVRGVVIVLIVLSLGPRIVEDYEFFKKRVGKMQDNTVVAAGEWLEANYPPETRIVYDFYSYIPPQFETIFHSWGQTEALIAERDPDIIIVHGTIRNRFVDPDRATEYVGGPEAYLAIHEFYARLEAEEFPCFRLTKDFGAVRIYERTPACVSE